MRSAALVSVNLGNASQQRILMDAKVPGLFSVFDGAVFTGAVYCMA